MNELPMTNRPSPTSATPSNPEDRKAQLANQLYEDATKMQKDAQELLRALNEASDKPSEAPNIAPPRPLGANPAPTPAPAPNPAPNGIRAMTAPVAQAANNALIGR